MGEVYNPYPKLPKNIRQIGERDSVVKLYMEDYVNTYLKRLYPVRGQDLRIGLLLGEIRQEDGVPYVFVDGAMEMQDAAVSGEQVEFTEAAWKAAYQTMENSFPKRSVVGWFLCGSSGSMLSPLNYWKQHGQYFSGRYQIMYLNTSYEGEEALYVASEEGFYRIRGYCIYYERNQMMQDYMVSRKEARRVESGARDEVIHDFRQKMEERKNEVKKQGNMAGMLGTACGVLSVAVLAGGITIFSNYHKMKQMESVIASVIPQETEALEIEEIPGKVYPIENIVIESSSSEEQPEQETKEIIPDNQNETAGNSAQASQTEEAAAIPSEAVPYIVQNGETLYGICLKRYNSIAMIDEICRWNHLEDENRITAGQELFLPPTQ